MLAWKLRQPIILGYVLAGMLISPFTPGPSVTHVHTMELFAEIGVILLMFSVGLEFSIKDLLSVRWVALIGGPLGILLSLGAGLLVGQFMGWTNTQGIVIGCVISVASTMVLTRLLIDRGELNMEHGRVMVAITLVEDLAVVILIVLLPNFGSLDSARLLILGKSLGKAALILVPALLLAAKILPPVLRAVARTRSPELFFGVVLAIGLGTAALTQAVGLSLALGAFVAGLMISESPYAQEALAQLFPSAIHFAGALLRDARLAGGSAILFADSPAGRNGRTDPGRQVRHLDIGVRIFGYSIWTAVLVGVASRKSANSRSSSSRSLGTPASSIKMCITRLSQRRSSVSS
jgi:CPA2 family monovalent cation:H+ antiporter-2